MIVAVLSFPHYAILMMELFELCSLKLCCRSLEFCLRLYPHFRFSLRKVSLNSRCSRFRLSFIMYHEPNFHCLNNTSSPIWPETIIKGMPDICREKFWVHRPLNLGMMITELRPNPVRWASVICQTLYTLWKREACFMYHPMRAASCSESSTWGLLTVHLRHMLPLNLIDSVGNDPRSTQKITNSSLLKVRL
jgi:hypothetical protein